jgi:iron-sulfur cluster assembly protein
MRVVGGGCSGFQHKLDLDPQVNEKLDEIFTIHGVDVVVDKRSLLYLEGVTVDYHNDLNKRGFSVTNPSAKSTCGCGSSFSM